jgi:hypothetical protein
MAVDMFARGGAAHAARGLPWVALVGVLVTAGVCVWLLGQPVTTFQNMAILDRYALGIAFVVLTAPGCRSWSARATSPPSTSPGGRVLRADPAHQRRHDDDGRGLDLMVVFLALETFSLGLYILAGLRRSDALSSEAAMKYFLLGAFASAFFVYGAALVYGATGSDAVRAIAASLRQPGA